MRLRTIVSGSKRLSSHAAALMCFVLAAPAQGVTFARSASIAAPLIQDTVKIPPDQLDSIVAPIALYPDPLLSQTLVAATYPLEIVQLHQFLQRNQNLKDKALVDAVSKQPWDPSIQAMAGLPDLVKRLYEDIQWTTDLGNAFLAQQSDVMDAVQRMRSKAQDKGTLVSNEQQKVETRVIESKKVIVVEQANPEVIYVPSYDPQWVWGPAYYPYPAIYYPPYYGGIVAASAISWGIGFAMGAFWGGGWGWGCGWGGNDIDINMNNNFNRNTNIGGGNRTNIGNRGGRNQVNPLGGNRGAGNKWQHNPSHRGGAPYRDRATANKFGGTARGDSLANRQSRARQQIGRQGGNLASTRDRAGSGGFGGRSGGAGVSDRSRIGGGGGRAGVSDRSRAGSGGFSGSRGGGGDRIGSRDISPSTSNRQRSTFGGGGSGRYNGGNARSSGSRGSSSWGGSRGGGSRGGGGFGGGSRGGGGGRGGGGRR